MYVYVRKVRTVATSDGIPRLLALQTSFKYLRNRQDNDLRSKINSLYLYFNEKNLRADPRENIPFSLLLLRVGFFLISLHQCYSLRTFAHLKEHS